MPLQSFDQVLILLLASVLVLALARRVGLPAILGYLIVGILLGPAVFQVLPNTEQGHAVASIGVVLLLFTLGLEVSFPRMVAMRREVFGLGSAQTLVVGGAGALVARAAGIDWASAIVVGGALAMCSTAIVLQQLGDQDELGRTHGRLSFAVLLFQDLAFVPLLALATVRATGQGQLDALALLRLVGLGIAAMLAVLVIGRWLLRPLLYEIAHSRLRELFTLTALLIVLVSAWITQWLGLSMALGAFLAGMMFAETEFRHQIEAVIRPFRELLLGLFFISVGLLLDLRLLYQHWSLVVLLLSALTLAKALLSALTVHAFGINRFKSLRTGLVLSGGGEFGVALLTVLAQGHDLLPVKLAQPVLATLVLSMILSPMLIRYNRRLARLMLRESGPPAPALPAELSATSLARREHVVLCGFGRVGNHLGRVLLAQGFEYLAVDLDPVKVRDARQSGEPVIYGDSSDEELLQNIGIDRATVVVVTFAKPSVALGIVRAVRRLRADVPILVRTPDDSRLSELRAAGATEVVPETFETSLTLVSQALTLLHVPGSHVTQIVHALRAERYGTLRRPAGGARLPGDAEPEQLRSIVLSPGSWAVGRQLGVVRSRGAEVAFTAVRRHGITGHEPGAETELHEGDTVVIYGTPEALEHAEKVLLAG